MGTLIDCSSNAMLNIILQHLMNFKMSQNEEKKYEIFICCYEIMADENEEVIDLIKSSMSCTSFNDTNSSMFSESDMQEI